MLSTHFTEDLLGLKGVNVKNIKENDTEIYIYIEMAVKPHRCPCCGTAARTVHDYRWQKIKDIGAFGKQVYLYLHKRRYRCPQCGKRFFEQNNFLPRYHRMTSRLVAYILQKLTDERSFTSVAREVNLSVSTVIRLFDIIHYSSSSLPTVLSIDEFKGNTNKEKYQCIITDPVNRRVVDILQGREKYRLIAYFKRFDRSHTTHFVSDMWGTYSDISAVYFKNAIFLVDRYHTVRQVIWALESVRKEVQEQLNPDRRKYFKRSRILLDRRYESLSEEEKQQVETMLYSSEKLLTAYALKEQFLHLLDCKNKEQAQKLLSDWALDASNSGIGRFVSCANTMVHWSKGILNSIFCTYTNGFTEGCNNKIKVLKRNAYGYRNFDRFRNRILHIFSHEKSEAV